EAVISRCWLQPENDNAPAPLGGYNNNYNPEELDTNGMALSLNGWQQVHNSVINLADGAFNRVKQVLPKNGFQEYGHSFYAHFSYQPFHGILGYRNFVIQLRDGSYRQFVPLVSHSSTDQQFYICNLDGSNRVDFTWNREDYAYSDGDMYFSILNGNKILPPEFGPAAQSYDLIFTRYYNEDPDVADYLPGVLSPFFTGVDQLDDIQPCDIDFNTADYQSDNHVIIGDDWKMELSEGVFGVEPGRYYLVQSQAGGEYLLSFCSYDAAQGTYEFLVKTRAEFEAEQLQPVAAFTLDQSNICPGESVQFINTSVAGESFEWIFQGGSPASSTERNPLVHFDNSGTFGAALTVKSCSNESSTKQELELVEVLRNPLPDFNFSSNGLNVSFNN
ncbi:MAG: PKD domain-containing protein, partial [Luteibaculum sp.]